MYTNKYLMYLKANERKHILKDNYIRQLTWFPQVVTVMKKGPLD